MKKDCILDVRIIDMKSAYGNTRYLVEPTAGSGSFWTENIIIPTPTPIITQ